MTQVNQIQTQGKMFTNIKLTSNKQAVRFTIQGKGECVVGFASDRNAFMEKFNDVIKEVSKGDVIKRLGKYKGSDAARLVKIITQQLRPVTLAAACCESCGDGVVNSVHEYSQRKFNKTLCRKCQPGGRERSERQSQQAQVKRYELVEETIDCPRCDGTGRCGPEAVHNGICFKCNGNKTITIKTRKYLNQGPSVSEGTCIRCGGVTKSGDLCDMCHDELITGRFCDEHDIKDCPCCFDKYEPEDNNTQEPFTLLNTWHSVDYKQCAPCHEQVPCPCGGHIKYDITYGDLTCVDCGVIYESYEYEIVSHHIHDKAYHDQCVQEAAEAAKSEAKTSKRKRTSNPTNAESKTADAKPKRSGSKKHNATQPQDTAVSAADLEAELMGRKDA